MADAIWKRDFKGTIQIQYPRSAGEDITFEGQSKMTAFTAHKEHWEMSKQVIDQSKTRWVISTFKPFKLPETDGTIPALLQSEV